MDPSDVANIIIIIVLLALSAFFSSAETAFTTVNRLRIRSLAEEKSKRAMKVLKIVEHPHKMLSTVLICNNIVNISASAITTTYTMQLCQKLGFSESVGVFTGISTGILTILVLIFGEITPKNLATKNAEKLALAYASIIIPITTLFTPLVYIINLFSTFILFVLRVDMSEKATITEDELRTFVDVSHEDGVIESEERQMITNIVDFGDTLVKDVMIPRMEMDMVSLDISYEDLLNQFTENKYARMPVYDESIDNIVGIINLKDFVFSRREANNFKLKELIRDVHFTYEYKNTAELFMEMRKKYISMTIVLDEYGALAGLLTMEDLLEEIVGDIRDEYDADEEDEIQKISDEEYIVLGSTNLDDIEVATGLPVCAEEYDSIAGHVINLLAHFPEKGEQTQDDYATYTVLEAEKNRIDKIGIVIKATYDEYDEY